MLFAIIAAVNATVCTEPVRPNCPDGGIELGTDTSGCPAYYCKCFDLDNGRNYDAYGATTLCSGPNYISDCDTQQDFCSENILTEYYCNNGLRAVEQYVCPYGCNGYRCSPAPELPIKLTSPNGGETLTRGKFYTISWTNGYSQVTDATRSVSLMLVKEDGVTQVGWISFGNSPTGSFSWNPANMKSSIYSYFDTPTPDGTYKIRVIDYNNPQGTGVGYDVSDATFTIDSQSLCTDSDGGKNYNTVGYVYHSKDTFIPETKTMYASGTYDDRCVDSWKLKEAYCNEDNELRIMDYTCPKTCRDGKCIDYELKPACTSIPCFFDTVAGSSSSGTWDAPPIFISALYPYSFELSTQQKIKMTLDYNLYAEYMYPNYMYIKLDDKLIYQDVNGPVMRKTKELDLGSLSPGKHYLQIYAEPNKMHFGILSFKLEATETPAGCVDTDSGLQYPANLGVRGACTDATGTYYDQCVEIRNLPLGYRDEASVIDWYCGPTSFLAENRICMNTSTYMCVGNKFADYCSNGACGSLAEPTCKTLGTVMFSASDGTGYIGCDIEVNGKFDQVKSYCQGQKTGKKISNFKIDEYLRENRYYETLTGLDKTEEVRVYIYSLSGKQIECLPPLNQNAIQETCTDSDGGKDYYSQGTVTDQATGSKETDSCYPDGKVLNEKFCVNGRSSSESYTCIGGCKEGVCIIEIPSTCGNGICDESENTCPEDCEKISCKSNSDCSKNDYCMFAPGICGSSGICTPKSDACTNEYIPVCGCDGVTYSNTCLMQSAKVSMLYKGKCANSELTYSISVDKKKYNYGDSVIISGRLTGIDPENAKIKTWVKTPSNDLHKITLEKSYCTGNTAVDDPANSNKIGVLPGNSCLYQGKYVIGNNYEIISLENSEEVYAAQATLTESASTDAAIARPNRYDVYSVATLGESSKAVKDYFYVSDKKKCSKDSDACGGISGLSCCDGYFCQYIKDEIVSYDSNSKTYPDRTGTCVKKTDEENCTDSDEGKDYFNSGTVSSCPTNPQIKMPCTAVADSCDGSTLIENYCENDGFAASIRFVCPSGCKNGTCIKDNASDCNKGCSWKNSCIDYGTRFMENNIAKFCNQDKKLTLQIKDEDTCQNSYECLSNSCINAKCKKPEEMISKPKEIISRLVKWISALFWTETYEGK
jgi:hypothetical protein